VAGRGGRRQNVATQNKKKRGESERGNVGEDLSKRLLSIKTTREKIGEGRGSP